MAAPIDLVAFPNRPPRAQEIADKIAKLTELDVRVEVEQIGRLEKYSIAFQAIPEQRIIFNTLPDGEIPEIPNALRLCWRGTGGTLLLATRIAVESLGGILGTLSRISEENRRKYGRKTTVEELLRRHRLERFYRTLWRLIGYPLVIPFLIAMLILCVVGLPFHRRELRRKTS